MGLISSKSPLERRNTVARRSQRRTIHTIKAKVDKVFPEIKRFKGVNQDEDYHALHSEIEHLQNELMRKSKELQPQIRIVYDNTLKRINEAFVALEGKMKENQEKAIRKEKEKEEKEKKKEKKNNKEDITSENNDVVVEEIEEEATTEANNLAQSTEKRHTVELKFVQVVPDETTEADIHSNNNNNSIVKSPEEKRKSILKHGVAVMPGAMMNEISARSSNTVSIQEHKIHVIHDSEKINAKINEIIENLQAIEYQIADFVGRKNGTQYNRIKDKLNGHTASLNSFSPSDDYTIEQIKICKNYVVSCINFLDEKATDEEKIQDDVFLPANTSPIVSPILSPVISPALSPVDARNKLERLSKTTAI